jgi:leucyl-tRNA synthetase
MTSTTRPRDHASSSGRDERIPPHRYSAALAARLEARWQEHWQSQRTFRTLNPGDPGFDASRPKFYCLDMFPYPSGAGLHVGHPLGYIATDVVSRYRRMRGCNVLHPMGFDAFGLPAEQYAVEHGVHPRITTERNIATMVRQLQRLGLGYDWDRRLATTDVGYYRWTQWIFLQLYQSWFDPARRQARPIAELVAALRGGARLVAEGSALVAPGAAGARHWDSLDAAERESVLAGQRLAYLAEVPVNWCPALGTVLANEEVTNDGRSERGNHPVFKRPLRQWMLRITRYADRLADELDLVDWPEPIKLMQRNWIGRSAGARIEFDVAGHALPVFTTRPDTLFGATFMAVAPEHPLVRAVTAPARRAAVEEYRRQAAARSDVDRMAEGRAKTGVDSGAVARNPATGRDIPVWVADYVLMGYGTGAIMGVPGQDQRDWEFARTHGLPIVRTVRPPADFQGEAYTGEGPAVNSGFLDGLAVEPARERMIAWLEAQGIGTRQVTYKLRDWLFSRQRYWGEPFPVLHAPEGRVIALREDELPVVLPEMDDFTPEASDDPAAAPRPPLGRAPESWRIVTRDGLRCERELNTMPQWAGSCWYYLRFIDPASAGRFVGSEAERYWMGGGGVDLYVGGAEHAVLHLLYARFWHKVLHDLGHVSTPEPFARLFNQGYIQAFAYRDQRGMVVPAEEVVDQDGRPAAEVQDEADRSFSWQGKAVAREYGKMGKSLKNATNPDDVCAAYGCDTLRLYEMYMGPLEASKPWAPRDIAGPFRFLQRLWRLAVDEQTGALVLRPQPDPAVEKELHRTIARVGADIERLALNTAIAALIEFVNTATAAGGITGEQLDRLLRILCPFAPHVAEELWSRLGRPPCVAQQPWPEADAALLVEDTVELPVQILGKLRGRIRVPAGADASAVEAAARADERIAALLEGKTIRKVIVVPGKIVNIVAG